MIEYAAIQEVMVEYTAMLEVVAEYTSVGCNRAPHCTAWTNTGRMESTFTLAPNLSSDPDPGGN